MNPASSPLGDSGAFDSLDVFRKEWDDIRQRRAGGTPVGPAVAGQPPPQLVGLALSGGGIRSAFNLGVLQFSAATTACSRSSPSSRPRP